MDAQRKPGLLYVAPYDVVRMQTGGGKRIGGIAKALSQYYSIHILSLSPSSRPLSISEVSPDVWMVAIPSSPEFHEQCRKRVAQCRGAAQLFAFAEHQPLLPEFTRILETLAGKTRIWMLPSPWALPAIQPFFRPDLHALVYDAHDELSVFIKEVLGCSDPAIMARAEQAEGELLERACLAAFCTEGNLAAAKRRYPAMSGKMVVVPNAVDVVACRFVPPSQALEFRKTAGLAESLAVFAGSNFKPNHEAVDWIVRELAPAYPQVVFVVMGMHLGPYLAFGGAEPRPNLVFTGPISEELKTTIFMLADLALAPLRSGTGSSLKIPDYVAHGKVVVGTPIGLRGFEVLSRFPSVIVTEDVVGATGSVLEALAQRPAEFDSACGQARDWAKLHLDWSVTVRPLIDALAAHPIAGLPGIE